MIYITIKYCIMHKKNTSIFLLFVLIAIFINNIMGNTTEEKKYALFYRVYPSKKNYFSVFSPIGDPYYYDVADGFLVKKLQNESWLLYQKVKSSCSLQVYDSCDPVSLVAKIYRVVNNLDDKVYENNNYYYNISSPILIPNNYLFECNTPNDFAYEIKNQYNDTYLKSNFNLLCLSNVMKNEIYLAFLNAINKENERGISPFDKSDSMDDYKLYGNVLLEMFLFNKFSDFSKNKNFYKKHSHQGMNPWWGLKVYTNKING